MNDPPIERHCLRCRKPFMSDGNWLCDKCNRRNQRPEERYWETMDAKAQTFHERPERKLTE